MSSWQEYFKNPIALKMYVIHTGNVHMAGNIHYNSKSPAFKSKPVDERFNPVLAYLVEHPKKGYVLFDTGVHASFAEKKTGNFGWLLGRVVKIKTSAGRDVPSQLKKLGLTPNDIGCVVLSHLHLDHPGGLPAFGTNKSLKVYVDEGEMKIAESAFGLFQGYIRKHLDGFNVAQLRYLSSVAPFDQVCDLFEDGSVFLIRTPGHTPGHVSALLNMKRGPVFLTFDAAHRASNVEEGIPPKGNYAAALDSVKRIGQFGKEFPSAMMIFGHDPDQITSLKKLPEYYA
jgi:glyoxylase-like metal-dependent hydrolase (beta-lactamase superfamily II)